MSTLVTEIALPYLYPERSALVYDSVLPCVYNICHLIILDRRREVPFMRPSVRFPFASAFPLFPGEWKREEGEGKGERVAPDNVVSSTACSAISETEQTHFRDSRLSS